VEGKFTMYVSSNVYLGMGALLQFNCNNLKHLPHDIKLIPNYSKLSTCKENKGWVECAENWANAGFSYHLKYG